MTTGTAADLVEVGHHVLAARLEVGDVRGSPRDPVEIVERELDLRFVRHGRDVKDGVRRAAGRATYRYRILEGFARHDVARADAEREQYS